IASGSPFGWSRCSMVVRSYYYDYCNNGAVIWLELHTNGHICVTQIGGWQALGFRFGCLQKQLLNRRHHRTLHILDDYLKHVSYWPALNCCRATLPKGDGENKLTLEVRRVHQRQTKDNVAITDNPERHHWNDARRRILATGTSQTGARQHNIPVLVIIP